ncbi:hypothetical protein ACHZ97_09430 [Lysobacter soli]|uniref:hypothetical protein n=1 Tax=Lysobacter soli TaxID=453783 RepID=UPI0037C935A3
MDNNLDAKLAKAGLVEALGLLQEERIRLLKDLAAAEAGRRASLDECSSALLDARTQIEHTAGERDAWGIMLARLWPCASRADRLLAVAGMQVALEEATDKGSEYLAGFHQAIQCFADSLE